MQKKFDVCRRHLQAHASDTCKPMQAMPASPCKRCLHGLAIDACMNVQMIPLRTEKELRIIDELCVSPKTSLRKYAENI